MALLETKWNRFPIEFPARPTRYMCEKNANASNLLARSFDKKGSDVRQKCFELLFVTVTWIVTIW